MGAVNQIGYRSVIIPRCSSSCSAGSLSFKVRHALIDLFEGKLVCQYL